MKLGKLNVDYAKLNSLNEKRTALFNSPDAFTYFRKISMADVYQRKPNRHVDAEFLISCDKDLMGVVPPGAMFKAFDASSFLGFVGLVGQKGYTLKLLTAPKVRASSTPTRLQPKTAVRDRLTYELVGSYQGKEIFARLDRVALKALSAGKNLSAKQLNAYETSMRKGVIPSGSTGKDGVKFDNQCWVIKLTISIAGTLLLDNSLSPMADAYRDNVMKRIYLNFNKLTMRH